MARLASGGRHGLAQSLFQVGGNAGSALGPLLAAFIVVPWGQGSIAWFSVAAVAAMADPVPRRPVVPRPPRRAGGEEGGPAGPAPGPSRRGGSAFAVGVLLCLIFSKYFYLASLTQLLHLLPDRHVRGVGGGRAAPPVRVPRGGRGRDVRSAGRSATGSGSRR